MITSPNPKSLQLQARDFLNRALKLGIRIPDTSAPEFAAEARRQSQLVSRSEHAAEDQAFVDSITVKWWEGGEWRG